MMDMNINKALNV